MRPIAPPPIPWQITGNHWVTLPCIHPADGSIHAVGLLHRGARAAIEFAGSPAFLEAGGTPLLRPTIAVNGRDLRLDGVQMAWERALDWLPAFSAAEGGGDIRVRGTVFAPYGRDADLPGFVYALSVENRGSAAASVTLALEGELGHRQQRVRTPRPFDDDHVVAVDGDRVVLEGSARPGLAALAVAAEPGAGRTDASGTSFRSVIELTVAGGAREQVAFHCAAAPERDGALATVDVMRRRGWRALLATTRDALGSLEQSSGSDAIDRLVNRHLLFAYFGAVGRALDDAHFYPVRSRIPWNGHGVTVRDWEALLWTLPAIQLADAVVGRELLLRMCEVHGYAPGRGVHYLDGALFEPGFSLEGLAAWPAAVDRYIRDTGDDQVVDEPIIADTLYLVQEDLAARRDRDYPLYSTDVTASGAPAPLPYTLHGNAVAALALDVLRRTLDEETARDVEDPAAVRAALARHFTIEAGGKKRFASAVDLAGKSEMEDDPAGSVLWLPLYEAVAREDSTYRRSVKALPPREESLAWRIAQIVGPNTDQTLEWLRRAALDNGVAAELVDASGAAAGNGGDATLSALIAWLSWYAVHALGARG